MVFDVSIIGFGPAGMSAAVYAKRFGLSTLVFEQGLVGGNAALSPLIENYLGFPEISGSDLVTAMENHAKKYVDKFVSERVEQVERANERFVLRTHAGSEEARAVIIATGTKHRELGVDGEKRLLGKGVSYCATCDGFFFRNKRVAVVGGGNTAAVEALYLREVGAEVYLIHRRDRLRAEDVYFKRLSEKKVNIIWNTVVKEILGEKKVEALRLENKDGGSSVLAVDGVFVAIGDEPQNEIARMLGANINDAGYVVVDAGCRTNVQYVYACGDLTGLFNQVIVAAAQGALAARSAYEDLQK